MIHDNGFDLDRIQRLKALGETPGLDVATEGIELESQVAAPLELGCIAGQGFRFARRRALERGFDLEDGHPPGFA